MAEEKETETGKKRKRGKARWIVVYILAFLVCAVLTFPGLWGPWLARSIVLSLLPSCEGCSNELNVEYVGFSETKISNAVFGGLPSCPAFEYASVKYTVPGLLRKTVDSVAVSGFTFKPEYTVENFSMASESHVGPVVVADDPLQGWSVKSAVFKTGEIDFGTLIPEEAPFILRNANLFCDLKLVDGNYTIKGEGVFCGNRFECGATYQPAGRAGTVTAKVFPRLKTKSPGKIGSVDLSGEYSVSSTNGYGVAAKAEVTVPSSSLKILAGLEAGSGGMSLIMAQPEVVLTENDGLVATALGMAKIPENVTDIGVSARIYSSGWVGIQPGKEPKWAFKAAVHDASGKANVDGNSVSVAGAGTKIRISGIGPHFDIEPFIVGYTNAMVRQFVFDRGSANFMLDEKRLMISEARLGFCDGNIRLYSLYFNLEKLFSGLTVFVDKLDLGKLFNMLPDTKGSATGYLYGRIPLFVRGNGEVWLSDAFIYSPPGDTGNISLADTRFIADYCNSIGVPSSDSENLAKAFENLNYSIFRFDMLQPRNESGKVKIRIQGESPQGRTKIPVNLDITINAPVQSLINYGLNPKSLVK